MELLGQLLEALSYVGSSLDKPGRAVRGALAGRFDELGNLIPFSDAMGITDEDRAVSGRDLLEQYGVLSQNQAGLDMGDVAGFGAEMLLDPTNLIGGGLLKKLLGSADVLKHAMPDDVLRATKMVDEIGNPIPMYHGTRAAYDQFDMNRMQPESLFGRGIYTTADPSLANSYAGVGEDALSRYLTPQGQLVSKTAAVFDHTGKLRLQPSDPIDIVTQGGTQAPNVRKHYIDARNPLNMDTVPPIDVYDKIREAVLKEYGIKARDQFDATMGLRDPYTIWKMDADEFKATGNYGATAYFGDPPDKPPDINDYLSEYGEHNPATGDRIYQAIAKAAVGKTRDNMVSGYEHGLGHAAHVRDVEPMDVLKRAGIDSIQHLGGIRAGGGNRLHDVTIGLDPSQMYPGLSWREPHPGKQFINPLAELLSNYNVARGAGTQMERNR